jgi:O-antigen ligase
MAWLLALLWAGLPLYPAFIALLPIAPPGLSLLGPVPALLLLLGVAGATVYVGAALWRDSGTALLHDPLVRAMGIYLASMAIPSTLGVVPPVGAVFCLIALCAMIGATAVRRWGADPRVAHFIALSLLISSAAASLLALFCRTTRQPAQLYVVGNGRAIGTFVVPGELAGYLGMLLPYALGLAWSARSAPLRRLAWGVALIDAAAMTATFSRAGLFGLLVAGIACAFILRPRLRLWLLVALPLVLAGIRRMVNWHHNPAENFNRFSIWHAAWRMFLLFPLWGVGPGGFPHMYPFVKLPDGEPTAFHAHSFLLMIAAETGLLGILGTGVLWITFAKMFYGAYRSAGARARLAALAIAGGFIATGLQSLVDVVQILFLGLWIPFMGMALVALEDGMP